MTFRENLRTGTIKVSVGEIVDRITILKLKLCRSGKKERWKEVEQQLREYSEVLSSLDINEQIYSLRHSLERINGMLWRLETEIRRREARLEFDDGFVCAARMIIRLNDRRATIKAQIDSLCDSGFTDFKAY